MSLDPRVTIYGDEQRSHIRVFRYAVRVAGARFGAYYIGRSGKRSFSSRETGKGWTRKAAVADLWKQMHPEGT
jgi:hypothetical protein